MASRYYCSNVAEELEIWSAKLRKLSSEIDRIPSINKYRLLPQIEELHIILTELDDRFRNLNNACRMADRLDDKDVHGGAVMLGNWAGPGRNEFFDYGVGG